ncbi:ADP-ribosylglycohydrolase family protein [Candidatus Bipolaricaulota bacterium]
MAEAHDLLRQAEAQYEARNFDRLVATIALVNRQLALGIVPIRESEPTAWSAYASRLQTLPSPQKGVLEHSAYVDRVKGAWLGKCIGTALGDPVEGWTRQAILDTHGSLEQYLVPPKTENDDTAYPVLVLHTLEEHGIEYTSEQLALEWIEHLPYAFTAEQVALDNIKAGRMPPESRWQGNPCGAWVGGQMRGEVHGLMAPLSPAVAANYAFRDAVLSHYREGLEGEIYAAVLISLAFADLPIEQLLQEALQFVPAESRISDVVEQTIRWCHRLGEWPAVVEQIELELSRYHWIHTLPNLACVVCGLILGEGDFERSLLTTVASGFDTDCSTGQVAALLGAILGASQLPDKWTIPLGDVLDTYVIGFERIEIDTLTTWTTKWGRHIAADRIA